MPPSQDNEKKRRQVGEGMQLLVERGLTSQASGNVSIRTNAGLLITPTGVSASELSPEQIVEMDLDGNRLEHQLRPSSEWRMHADLYRNKPEVNAVVHCHSNYATMLACAHKPIPSMHYMVASIGSSEVPLADYALFGSQALSDASLRALSESSACLLANHGQLTVGHDLAAALHAAEVVEELAFWYWGVLAIGAPKLLNTAEMDDVFKSFASYGQQKEVSE